MAAKAYLVEEFDDHISEIVKLDMNVARYVRECNPTMWAHCHFQGRRYSIMTTTLHNA